MLARAGAAATSVVTIKAAMALFEERFMFDALPGWEKSRYLAGVEMIPALRRRVVSASSSVRQLCFS